MNNELKQQLEEVKKSILVLDIETSAHYPDGTVIEIKTNFDDYLKYAQSKWIGFYSYKYDEYVNTPIKGHEETIREYIAEHDFILGFNSIDFDNPILYNNDILTEEHKYQDIDLKHILTPATFFSRDKKPYKGRGGLMGLKPKKYSLKEFAIAMGLETLKGDIDYSIFHKDEWTPEETAEIIKYLQADIEVTKLMFDRVWEFWLGFTEWLYPEQVLNLSWIKSSIASLRYNCDCKTLGFEAIYGERAEGKEKMGGNVIAPRVEEARNVWYLDFKSLYPHLAAMFNLYSEVDEEFIHNIPQPDIFHQSKDFEVRGYYDITEQHPICKDIIEKIKIRSHLQKTDPDNPLIYCIKIFLNAGYGALRSSVFEQIHTPNAGWDTCWLGQQFQKLFEDMMGEFGFDTIAGDTDSIFVVFKKTYPVDNLGITAEQYVKNCLGQVTQRLLENCPFPSDTFSIDIEKYLNYVMWPFDDQPIEFIPGDFLGFKESLKTFNYSEEYLLELYKHNQEAYNKKKTKKPNIKAMNSRLIKVNKGKKKNYVYIYHDRNNQPQVKIMGLPIKKNNATVLGPVILKEVLIPKILAEKSAKFEKEFIHGTLAGYLSKPEGMEMLAQEYRVKQASTYKPTKDGKPSNHINAQISRAYFNGQDGIISLIKTKIPTDPEKKGYISVGKAGASVQYCTVEEAVDNLLSVVEVDIGKVIRELQPFVSNSP